MDNLRETNVGFEQQKRAFFVNLGLRAREWLKQHRDLGKLWEGKKEDRWENVSEHCLVEAARAEVFADLMKLSPEVKERLFAGAVLHDFDKKDEMLSTVGEGRTPESFMKSYDLAKKKLDEAGVDKNIAEIADSVGPSSFKEIDEVVNKQELSEQDIARLVLHYIDDYTLNTNWVEAYDGNRNAFDVRMDANEANEKYKKLNEAGWFREQRRLGLLVENRISELLKARGVEIETKKIPEFIDAKIKEKIEQLN